MILFQCEDGNQNNVFFFKSCSEDKGNEKYKVDKVIHTYLCQHSIQLPEVVY